MNNVYSLDGRCLTLSEPQCVCSWCFSDGRGHQVSAWIRGRHQKHPSSGQTRDARDERDAGRGALWDTESQCSVACWFCPKHHPKGQMWDGWRHSPFSFTHHHTLIPDGPGAEDTGVCPTGVCGWDPGVAGSGHRQHHTESQRSARGQQHRWELNHFIP